jgi:dihydropyrimidine dehydrogenase (NAD+) subunit PreT
MQIGRGVRITRPRPGQNTPEVNEMRQRRRRFALLMTVIAIGALAVLIMHGGGYYLLGPVARLGHQHDRSLRPSGLWGHGVGIVSTLVMLMNFLYPVRKRARSMHRMGSVPTWLIFHVSIGLMTPLVILFHAAFRFNNLIATSTYGSLLVVVTTGVIGRYIYSMVPGSSGYRSGELADLQRSWQEMLSVIRSDLEGGKAPAWLERLLQPPVAAREASPARALVAVLRWPVAALRARSGARALARRLPHEQGHALIAAVGQMVRLRLQIEFFGGIKRLLATWRLGHSLLAVFLVAVIIVHVAVSVAFGYRWIF